MVDPLDASTAIPVRDDETGGSAVVASERQRIELRGEERSGLHKFREREDPAGSRRRSDGIGDVAIERRLARLGRQRVARFEKCMADRISRVPAEACDLALQRALAIIEADRAEALGPDHRAYCGGAAD